MATRAKKRDDRKRLTRRPPRGKPTEPVNIQAREHEVEALTLRKQGYTYREIGKQLGISGQSAHARVMVALHETAKLTEEKAVEVRAIELERLDALQKGLWSKAELGDVGAVYGVIRIMQRRADMLGMDAPKKHEVMGKDGEPIRIEDARANLAGTVARLAAAIEAPEDPGKPE